MSDSLKIRKGDREITIQGKTVEDWRTDDTVYLLPFIGQLLFVADQLSGYADIRSKVTIHTDRGDFVGYGRDEKEAEEKAWKEFERQTGFRRPSG